MGSKQLSLLFIDVLRFPAFLLYTITFPLSSLLVPHITNLSRLLRPGLKLYCPAFVDREILISIPESLMADMLLNGAQVGADQRVSIPAASVTSKADGSASLFGALSQLSPNSEPKDEEGKKPLTTHLIQNISIRRLQYLGHLLQRLAI